MPRGVWGTTPASSLKIEDFPRDLRRVLHAKARLEDRTIGDIIIELVARGLVLTLPAAKEVPVRQRK